MNKSKIFWRKTFPADSLNLMFRYFDKRFEAMQNQIDRKYRIPPRNRTLHNDHSFKSKDNPLEFKFKSGLKDKIEDILDDLNPHESSVEALNTIISKTLKRNKVIKIADRALVEWATIAEYEETLLQEIRKILRKCGGLKKKP